MGDIEQAELQLKYLFFFFLVSAARSGSSAETLRVKRQQSTCVFAGALTDYSKTAFS